MRGLRDDELYLYMPAVESAFNYGSGCLIRGEFGKEECVMGWILFLELSLKTVR